MTKYTVTQTVVYTWYTKALDAEDALTVMLDNPPHCTDASATPTVTVLEENNDETH